ncbi:MAG: cytidylate kinase-like family protein [Gemmatimonadota bacterium]|jgi:cytidylate kinase
MSQIICVSRGSLSRGKELAEHLSRKLDYPVLSREDLIEAAIKDGIQVGKLETSMMKPRAFTERLARERDHYLAFCTAYLCDRAMEGPLIYHGRTGHLLLRGVSHLMRVRVVAEEEYRIAATMRKLNVGREQAQRYLDAVEEDRRNWARSMYGVSWEDASQYDVIVNVERMSVQNAASALVGMSQLPDFQMTPASRKAMEDLRLGARARLRLARDARTARAAFSVRAHDGVVTVTYLPHDADAARDIPQALAGLDGVQDLRATMAATTILWVQEAFDAASETFQEVVEIARKWNAAVELVRYTSAVEEDAEPSEGIVETEADTAVAGIEDDVDEVADTSGLKATLDELARVGKAGGGRYVHGERRSLVASCCGAVSYSLVVLGNLFLNKDQAARVRFTRELQESLASRLRVPVVTTNELKSQYLFGRRDLVRLAGFLALVIALYLLVLSNQEPILAFLFGSWSGGGWTTRLIVAVAVFSFVPIVAYSYGSVARSVMKLIKME